jgi:hypothetical protein
MNGAARAAAATAAGAIGQRIRDALP